MPTSQNTESRVHGPHSVATPPPEWKRLPGARYRPLLLSRGGEGRPPSEGGEHQGEHLDSADVVSFHRRRGRRRAARTGLWRTRRRAGTIRRPTGSPPGESGDGRSG